MRKLFSAMRNAPKRASAIVAMIAAAVVVPAALLAWGPDRPTYAVENPADHITFNSITNNPDYGDERNFVRIKDASNTTAGGWSDEINVQAGKEYLVQMYVHNNAASSLNLTAKNTTVKAHVPTTTGKSVQIDGFITSPDAQPNQVWDQAIFKSDRNFNLAYVPGSATYYNNVFPTGTKLSDSIVTNSGSLVGYNKMDGNVPGCFQYSGYVSFKVKPQVAAVTDFTLQKKVSKHGANTWVEDYEAQPGETVDFLLAYKNTGEVQHNDVTFRDTLPAGLSYVSGSTTWGNASGTHTASDNITGPGINVGSYAPGANAYTIFSAKVAANDNLPVCGPNSLVNTGKVTTGGYTVDDTASVSVPKVCQPVAKYTCDALTVTKLSRTSFKFDTDYTVENAMFKSVTYVIRDADGEEIARTTNPSYTQTTVGKYTVQAIVTVTVNGVDKTVTSNNCKKPFEVVALPPASIEVCELATKTVITIKETDFDASKHSKDLNDCKEEMCPIPGKENLPKDSADCKEVTPVTPTELPTTGPTETAVSVIGLGSLIASAGYYMSSRRALGRN